MFIDEWDVDAPQEAVFNALVGARTYPEWWKPFFVDVKDGERDHVNCGSGRDRVRKDRRDKLLKC